MIFVIIFVVILAAITPVYAEKMDVYNFEEETIDDNQVVDLIESKDVGNNTIVEYTLSDDGMFRFKVTGESVVKVLIKCDEESYIYNLVPNGDWSIIPAVFGNGQYKLYLVRYGVTKVKSVDCVTCTVNMEDTLSVFSMPNQCVNYEDSELILDCLGNIDSDGSFNETVCSVYRAVSYIVYDYTRAYTNLSWYLPNLDNTIKRKMGVCYDIASLMCSALRLSGIKCRLIFGSYSIGAGKMEHAWVDIWDGEEWIAVDPTINPMQDCYSIDDIVFDDSDREIHCVY